MTCQDEMKRSVARNLRILAAVLVIGFGAVSAFAANREVGEVVFLAGEATAHDAAGKARALARGDRVTLGQTLETGGNGHMHLRMIDNAFVSLRPDTRFRIEEYHYDAQNSASNRVKFVLEKGVARSITGKAGQANKRNYRLNTPLAAIGIRGTDYVVHVLPDVTRVSVNAGAVVMAPFGEDCRADALGPCESARAALLTAAMRNAYLELRARDTMPVVVPAVRGTDSPDRAVPPRPEEPRAGAKDGEQSGKLPSAGGVAEGISELVASDVITALEQVRLPPQQIWWGRWSSFVKPDEPQNKVTALLAPGREVAVVNPVFGLLRQAGAPRQLPPGGEVQFQLSRAEAYLRDGDQLSPATVGNPTLAMNFDQRSFSTNLTVQHNSLNAPLNLHAEGTIQPYGIFWEDPSRSNMRVDGAIAPQADQAGYLFLRDLGAGRSAVGATQWWR
jgi:hypothetical protein